ncbi:hypothetical protein JM79_3246 [Gramella sp. Hel_I_59]|nr:hypothetical protein JM79_3246 [Gramella sp. Hel_I_59]
MGPNKINEDSFKVHEFYRYENTEPTRAERRKLERQENKNRFKKQ